MISHYFRPNKVIDCVILIRYGGIMNRENIVGKLFWSVLLISPVLFIFQGLDFTDMGYIFTHSQEVATNLLQQPKHVHDFAYLRFLSMFLNGIWMKLTAPWGLVGARFGIVVLLWAVFFISNMMLKDFIPSAHVPLLLLLTFAFTQRTFWPSYNEFSALLALLSLHFFLLGFKSDNRAFCLLAGSVSALAFFARIPNVLMIGFSIIPLLVSGLCPKQVSLKKGLRDSTFFVAGWFLGLLFMLLLLWRSGYLPPFLNSLFGLGDNSLNPSYSLPALLSLFLKDHVRVFGVAVLFFLVVLSGSLILAVLPRCFRLFGYCVSAMLSLTWGWFFYEHAHYILILIGIVYVYLLIKIWYLVSLNRPATVLFFIVSALAVMLTVSLGSNNGIINGSYAMWLALPVFLHDLTRLNNLGFVFDWRVLSEGKETNSARCFKRLLFIVLLLVGFISLYRYTYRDSPDRFAMRYSIDHPKLRWTFTTSERASLVKGVLDELEKYVRPGDYMLAYPKIPTFHYLTDTRPYLISSGPAWYTPETLQYHLKRASEEWPSPPVVLRTKGSSPYDEVWMIIEEFLVSHHYTKTWENNDFEILLPGASEGENRE